MNSLKLLKSKIFIAGLLLLVFVLLYGAIGSCFYTYFGYGQIATDFSAENRIENCIDFFDGNEHKKVYCDKLTYDLTCSIQEYNPNSCYFMEIGYCSLWPEYGKLRAIKLVQRF